MDTRPMTSVGVCPDGGAHTPTAGFNYLLLSGLSASHQDFVKGWFLCEKCRGLFIPEGDRNGDCAKGGTYKPTGPADGVWKGAAPVFMEAGWSGCAFCFALYWGNGGDNGVCPDPFNSSRKHVFGFNYSLILLR